MSILLLACLSALCIGAACGVMAANAYRRRCALWSPLSIDGLRERAEVDHAHLVVIARSMRNIACQVHAEPERTHLLYWALICEQAAVHHLECINTLSLEALQNCTDQPIYLGEFRAGDTTHSTSSAIRRIHTGNGGADTTRCAENAAQPRS